jgi:hypothetical protein
MAMPTKLDCGCEYESRRAVCREALAIQTVRDTAELALAGIETKQATILRKLTAGTLSYHFDQGFVDSGYQERTA